MCAQVIQLCIGGSREQGKARRGGGGGDENDPPQGNMKCTRRIFHSSADTHTPRADTRVISASAPLCCLVLFTVTLHVARRFQHRTALLRRIGEQQRWPLETEYFKHRCSPLSLTLFYIPGTMALPSCDSWLSSGFIRTLTGHRSIPW